MDFSRYKAEAYYTAFLTTLDEVSKELPVREYLYLILALKTAIETELEQYAEEDQHVFRQVQAEMRRIIANKESEV